ncbi:MAG: GAF domain-containing protein [Bryobacteraceae bacterium]
MVDAANHFALSLAWTPAAAVVALLAVLASGWLRERRSRLQHRTMQRMYKLGEELAAARSLAESLRLLQSVLPGVLGVTDVQVYVPDRASKVLQRLEVDAHSGLPQPAMLAGEPIGFLRNSVALCFRNRSSIAVPDTRRSPLFEFGEAEQAPRSAMFLPMCAQDDVLGVLAITYAKRCWHFGAEERALAQHLANQLAIGMRLLEQKSLRESESGVERLNAAQRLVASAAEELKRHLGRIVDLAQLSLARTEDTPLKSDMAELAKEAEKASDLLSRIRRLTTAQTDGQADLGSTLQALLESRAETWEQRHVRLQKLVGAAPIIVAARPEILEQVLVSLIWHLERRLEAFPAKIVTARAFRMAAMAHVEISWPPAAETDAFDRDIDTPAGVLGLRSCRDLVQSQGGQLKLSEHRGGEICLDLELPMARREVTSALPEVGPQAVSLTALVLEPDAEDRRALVSLLCDLGHRAVPASGCEEAVELAKRLPFDVLCCSTSLPGETWAECFERSRDHLQAFVLLTRGHDPALAATPGAGGPRTLGKPVRREELAQVLQGIGRRGAAHGR